MSKRLTEEEIADIRTRPRSKHVIATIMEDYDLSYLQIWRILTGRTYKQYEVVTTDLPAQTVEKVPKLSLEQIHEITSTPNYWGKQTYFANKFGVSRTTIQRILQAYETYYDVRGSVQ